MAPFLGKYRVPGFEPLLQLFPESSKTFLISTSAFLMGIVAVVVQFYSGETITRSDVSRRFKRSAATILVAFFTLVTLYSWRVLRVKDPETGRYEPVVLGWWRISNAEGCGCTTRDDFKCAEGLGFGADLGSCWPHYGQVMTSLQLIYLGLTGGFGGLIGLLLLQEEARRQTAEKDAAEKEAREGEAKEKEAKEKKEKKEKEKEEKKEKKEKKKRRESRGKPVAPAASR
ncbi:MAG TPA: hypothetical protein VGC93_19195 [Thermoanaerobaculia bacterium]